MAAPLTEADAVAKPDGDAAAADDHPMKALQGSVEKNKK